MEKKSRGIIWNFLFSLIYELQKQLFSRFKMPPGLNFHYSYILYIHFTSITIKFSLIESKKLSPSVTSDQLIFIILENLKAAF